MVKYFRADSGGYGAPDRFLGLTVPAVREVARRYRDLPLADLSRALDSPWHEERLFALLVLVDRYGRAAIGERDRIFRLYWRKRRRINNWDLVDLSAPAIVGAHLSARLLDGVLPLLRSARLWDRRTAVLATFHAIRHGDVAPAFLLAERCLGDPHDLVHKACGWMLREAGHRDRPALERFLRAHAADMPRTMLRYATEKLPAATRRRYLAVRRHRC